MTTKIKIYHNPSCSKSREALQLLQKQKVEFDVIEYLKTPFTEQELNQLLLLLKIEPLDLIRKNESIFKELKLIDAELTREQWIQTLIKHPKLIQRPIIVNNKKA